MSWRDLVSQPEEIILPWLGGRKICSPERNWTIEGPLPTEYGWYGFEVDGGRKAKLQAVRLPPLDPFSTTFVGYLVGDRFIRNDARIDPDPDKLVWQTEPVFLVEPGHDRFCRAKVGLHADGNLIFERLEFPLGPENDALAAYQDRKDNLDGIKGVTPALDLAFRWISRERVLAEERRLELERLREEERKQQEANARYEEALRNAGTAVGRRAIAGRDFETAAREALRVSGAELLDVRESYNRGEMVVQYRFMNRSLECTITRDNLWVVDAGICLGHGDAKGDTLFSLEALPGIAKEAIDGRKLVVYRHVGTPNYEGREDYNYDEEDDW